MSVQAFHDFQVNPSSTMVEAGRDFAQPHGIDMIVAVGGGSSMDCAKAINLLLTSGGKIRDYWGYGKATQPLLPMVAVPTTAGTGSEAQSYATIIDAASGTRMACGDRRLAFQVAVLDPKLTTSQPAALTAASGYDALSHALESLVTTRQTALSDCFSRSAWRLINSGLERVIADPQDLDARGEMLLGAHFGGLAVENSMLGAAHACAYPLTGHFGIPHGVAIALVLPHVVEWNMPAAQARYEELYRGDLLKRLRQLAETAGLPATLRDVNIQAEALPRLAEDAGTQWTGKFNPRPFDTAGALEIYQRAL
jgi:alcohol dehydrogenase